MGCLSRPTDTIDGLPWTQDYNRGAFTLHKDVDFYAAEMNTGIFRPFCCITTEHAVRRRTKRQECCGLSALLCIEKYKYKICGIFRRRTVKKVQRHFL
jgi:hypothetical protein